VNLLAQILPGIREIRASLASGAAWSLAVLVVLGGTFDPLLHVEMVHRIAGLASKSEAIGIAVLSMAAYLVGSLTVDATTWLFTKLSTPFALPVRSAQVVRDYIVTQLIAQGIPVGWLSVIPFDVFERQILEFGPLQIYSNRKDQYEVLDRQSAEIELRLGLVFPLVVLAAGVGFQVSWVAGIVIGGLAIVLSAQAFVYSRRGMVLIGTQLGLGNIPRFPVLNATIERIAGLRSEQRTEPKDLAIGLFAGISPYLSEQKAQTLLGALSRKAGTPRRVIEEEAAKRNTGRSAWA
jgi:hypothetical protein